MAIEGEFGISLSADEVIEMSNVGLIRAILRRHGVTA
jgi:acyl carrier protein